MFTGYGIEAGVREGILNAAASTGTLLSGAECDESYELWMTDDLRIGVCDKGSIFLFLDRCSGCR